MALTEAALKKLTKEENVKLTLIIKIILIKTWKVLKRISLKWRKTSLNLKLTLLSPNKLTTFLRNQMVQVEPKSWSNEQYSRCECPEIFGILATLTDSPLKETTPNIFEEIGISINLLDVEAYHCVGPTSRKKVIIKMSRQKDADRVRRVKKILKDMKIEPLEDDNPIL